MERPTEQALFFASRYSCLLVASRLALPNASLRILGVLLECVDRAEFFRSHRLICWPSISTVRAASGLSHGSVINGRQALVAAGLVTRIHGGEPSDQIAVFECHPLPLQSCRVGGELRISIPHTVVERLEETDEIAHAEQVARMTSARLALQDMRRAAKLRVRGLPPGKFPSDLFEHVD